MTPVRREPLAEQAADALLTRIRGGEWALGQKLPGETTLAPQLGVGRSTIREAIRHLAGRGVLASRQGAGVFVTALDVQDGLEDVLRRAGIVAVVEARTAIEVEASSLAAERRTSAELRAMRDAIEHRRGRRDSIEEHVDADTALHRTIVVAAHSPLLTELFDGLTPRSRQAMVELLRIRGAYGSDADHVVHAEIVDAIEAGDPAVAATRTRAHLRTLTSRLA